MAFDFPSSPSVGALYPASPGPGIPQYRWDGQAWVMASAPQTGAVRYDVAQGLTYLQQAQARSNTGALKKNYIVNGAMQVSQENGATAGTTTGYYVVDEFFMSFSQNGAVSLQQVASRTPGGSDSAGSGTAACAVFGATDSTASSRTVSLGHHVRGLRVWRSANRPPSAMYFNSPASLSARSSVPTHSSTNPRCNSQVSCWKSAATLRR